MVNNETLVEQQVKNAVWVWQNKLKKKFSTWKLE